MKRLFVLLQRLLVGNLLLPRLWVMTLLLTACVSPTQLPLQASYPDYSGTPPPPRVRLILGSWRTDDVSQMRGILTQFNKKYPHIVVDYETYDTSDIGIYLPEMEAMLKQGKAPDVFYIPSFDFGEKLYNEGYLQSLNQLDGLEENFTSENLAPWTNNDGKTYGVPLMNVSYGIYYNQDLFNKFKLNIPQTWQELLQTARILKNAGIIPFANASGDAWTMSELVYLGLLPNFIGGTTGRLAYLNGERCFNDADMVQAFQAVKDISEFFPKNQKYLKYNDSLQIFLQGNAAMWVSGSWDIHFLEEQAPDFEWGVFAIPPPAGRPLYVTYHPDVAIGLNSASAHKNEARLFLEWVSTSEFAGLISNELPGAFSPNRNASSPDNLHARQFLALSEKGNTDIRFAWQKISAGTPDAYALIRAETTAISHGSFSPQQAADDLQTGLSAWYAPAKNCSQER
ncbi:MAG: extracellular solute-binding protein [Anaerolineae bacterium]|nr:extracellular solute-binding protein [Anaerolineae bacterium]